MLQSFSHLHSWFVCQESGQQQLPIYTTNSEIKSGNRSPPRFSLISTPHCLTHDSHHFTFSSCQTEGCDGVLGTGSVIDKCGVCGGRDTSCQKVTGSFQNVTVPLGYHKILDIPSGATFINITERKASPNYLGKNRHKSDIVHRLFKISRTIMVGNFSQSELLVSLFVLA